MGAWRARGLGACAALVLGLGGCRAFVVRDASAAAGAAATTGVQQGAQAIDSPEVKAETADAARSLFVALRTEATSAETQHAIQLLTAAMGAGTREELAKAWAELLSPAHRAELRGLVRDLAQTLIDTATAPQNAAKVSAFLAQAVQGPGAQLPPVITQSTTAAIAPVRAALDAEIAGLEHWIEGLAAGLAGLLVALALLTRSHGALKRRVAAQHKTEVPR